MLALKLTVPSSFTTISSADGCFDSGFDEPPPSPESAQLCISTTPRLERQSEKNLQDFHCECFP